MKRLDELLESIRGRQHIRTHKNMDFARGSFQKRIDGRRLSETTGLDDKLDPAIFSDQSLHDVNGTIRAPAGHHQDLANVAGFEALAKNGPEQSFDILFFVVGHNTNA